HSTTYNFLQPKTKRSSEIFIRKCKTTQVHTNRGLISLSGGGVKQSIIPYSISTLSSSQDVHASPDVEVDVIIIVVVIRLLHATRPILRLVRPDQGNIKDGVSLLLHLIEVLESLHLFINVVQFPARKRVSASSSRYLFLLRVLLNDLPHHLLVFCVHLLVLLRRFAHLSNLGLVVEESLRESLDQTLPLTHNLLI
ncbi:hypothetical protein PENTCL1PPCAC_13694, partial [Pristionchus entomophagus]